MGNVFQRATGKRLKHRQNGSEVGPSPASCAESEALLNQFREVIVEVESAQQDKKEQAINSLKDLHSRHTKALKSQCLTGPTE